MGEYLLRTIVLWPYNKREEIVLSFLLFPLLLGGDSALSGQQLHCFTHMTNTNFVCHLFTSFDGTDQPKKSPVDR